MNQRLVSPRISHGWIALLTAAALIGSLTQAVSALEPIPDRLVVLTFDDSAKSHFTHVRPLLKQFGFGATFFITEGFDFKTNRRDYMSWDEIAQLHRDGFEIGNHTRDHLAVQANSLEKLAEQLQGIRDRCQEHGIPAPVTFAYPGNATHPKALDILREHGIRFARRGSSPEFAYESGRGIAYEPHLDHPLLIPTAGDARPRWTTEDFVRAVQLARQGRIAVLQFHGVPDTAHDWVSTSRENFASWLNYLATNDYKVIALRDLAKYVDPTVVPSNPLGPIEDRVARIKAGRSLEEPRPPKNDADLREWLENMVVGHGFTTPEICAATGLGSVEVEAAVKRLGLRWQPTPALDAGQPLRVLPYPGGRHPRIGFRDGALRPQRETKVSLFAPWADGGYVVVDVPEAIWFKSDDRPRLLYLAHTHVPTIWDDQQVQLDPLEWRRRDDGRLEVERRLPNGATFGARVTSRPDDVHFELWLRNGTDQTLTDLRVQNCVMLAAAKGFEPRSNDNKLIRDPFVACRDETGRRWVITAWQSCFRPWANPPCPCIHSDPKFPDCPSGEMRSLQGWLRFYEGPEIDAELARLRSVWKLP